ncbi:MAG: thioredoxin family protein [Flavisolibacter sp.]
MKKIFLIALVFLSSFTTIEELPIGSPMPKADVKMKDVSGREVSLREVISKNGLLVMFSCNTCPYVIKNQQRTKETCLYAQEQGIGVILINANETQRDGEDSFAAMQAYAADQEYHWFYALDSHDVLADAFGAKRTPENFLFNRDGILVYHGAIDDNPSDARHVKRQHLKEAINELLQGREISVKTSRSVGCSIKRL